MKKIIACLCLIGVVITSNAQTQYYSQGHKNNFEGYPNPNPQSSFNTDTPYDQAFIQFTRKNFNYNKVPNKYLAGYIEWLEKHKAEHLSKANRIVDVPRFTSEGPAIQVKTEDGGIASYPIVFSNAEYISERRQQLFHPYSDSDIITFYNTQYGPKDKGMVWESIHGRQYDAVFTSMNKINIGVHSEDIYTCFEGIKANETLLCIAPVQYMSNANLGDDKLIITINATYSGKPSVIYTKPQFEIVGGQLMEVNNGIHYEVPTYNASFLNIVNTKTMRSEAIALEGISNLNLYQIKKEDNSKTPSFLKRPTFLPPKAKEKNDSPYLIAFDGSSYGKYGLGQGIYETISMNQSPIYIIEVKEGELMVKASIVPKKGDIITDIQMSKCGKYIYMCGTNRSERYPEQDYGIFCIYDSQTYEEISRQLGGRTDRYFTKIMCIDDYNVYVRYNDWDINYHTNYGGSSGNFKIFNINTIIPSAK